MAVIAKKIWEAIRAYLLLGARIASIESHTSKLNDEVGGVEKRLRILDYKVSRIAEDVAYLRGRVDSGPHTHST